MRLLAAVLAIVLSGSSSNERAIGLLNDWIRAVDAHRAGESDAALARRLPPGLTTTSR